jgi:hypothetical protein
MIISHKYKFIFIKTRKTAGTTIEYNLSKYLGNDDIIAPSEQANYLAQNYIQQTSLSRFFEFLKFKKLSKNFYFEFTDHMHAIHIKKKIDNKIYQTYFKFCVEREPVDKSISYYFMRKNSPNSNSIRKKMSWIEFVNKKRFPVDTNFYTHNNKLIIDKIIRYENLENELSLVLNDLGIKNFKIEKSVNNKFRGINPIITKNQKKIIYKEFQSSLKFVNY